MGRGDRSAGSIDRRALGLDLAELVAMEPRFLRRPSASGLRGPGGERIGRGWAQSTDFDGISPYHVGDDVRAIDWRATARSGKTQMRRFAAPSFRARMVVADLDPTLCFGTRERLMAKTVALVAARLCWESLSLHEPVGLALGTQARLQRPRRGKRHVLRLLDLLQEGYAGARAGRRGKDVPALLQESSTRLRKADEICLVSDFGALDESFLRLSGTLAGRRVLRAFVVEDALFQSAIPAGRYPLRHPDRPEKTSVLIDAGRGDGQGDGLDDAAHSVAALRRARNRQLLEAGWEVTEVADILPRSPANQP